jgi:hypothetical protein
MACYALYQIEFFLLGSDMGNPIVFKTGYV